MDTQTAYQVLRSITQAQETFLQTESAVQAFSHLLDSMMTLSESRYGFIGRVSIRNEEAKIQLLAELHAGLTNEIKSSECLDQLQVNLDFGCILAETLKQQEFQSQEQPQTTIHTQVFPDDAPPIERLLVFPIIAKNKALGLLVLTNSPTPYSSHFINALQDHQNSIAHLLYVAKLTNLHGATQAQLNITELRLRQSQKIAKVGSWERDIDHERVIWSDELYRIYDYSPDKVKASFVAELNRLHPTDKELYITAYREALNGAGLDIYYRIKSSTGQIKTLHNIAEFQIDKTTGQKKLLGLVQDVTGQVAVQTQLSHSQINFRSIIETIPVPIVALDASLNIRLFNHAAEHSFAYQQNHVVGKSIQSLLTDDSFEILASVATDFINKGNKTQSYELEGLSSDGNLIPIKATLAPVKRLDKANASDLVFIGIFYDLTEMRIAEQILHRSSKMDALGHMAGGIAHDFNNILNIVSGHLEILEMQQADNEKVTKRVSSALKGIERGNQLTAKLSRLSRIDHNDNQPTRLSKEINDIKDLLTESVHRKVALKFNLQSNQWINLDIGNFTDVLINLCINANDAMSEGGEITISTEDIQITEDSQFDTSMPLGSYILLQIQDNGCGMPDDVKEHIFDPFFTTKAKSKGTGLGLSLTYNFVKSSNGFIFVTSTPDIGSTFSLYFPIIQLNQQHTSNQLNNEDNACHGKKVLLVDDETAITKLLSTFMQHYGLDVHAVHSGEEALIELDQNSYDLMLSDITMPGEIDGINLTIKTRQNLPKLPIILMSGNLNDSRLEQAELASVPLLGKPFKKKELLEIINRVFRAREIG
ncbi:hypothetical protein C2869_21605 [Saccharobesus litoralis]|uniref:histidine kinase n=1 Tax=Saccharobesus litoralis TaxID=2172099 RepID=A0A2S0VX82_9ALTE|nr:response regulator [Saccharobesus litoralis]AWB68836.1 hypothetical protein C2869_21605 [Saccharobesus litoralis]